MKAVCLLKKHPAGCYMPHSGDKSRYKQMKIVLRSDDQENYSRAGTYFYIMRIISKEHFDNMKMMCRYFKEHSERSPLYIPEYNASKGIIFIIENETNTENGILKIEQLISDVEKSNHENGSAWFDFVIHTKAVIRVNTPLKLDASQSYYDWKDFFTKRLVDTGAFCLTGISSKGTTEIEAYSALKGNLDTTISVGYVSPGLIIYLLVFNPATPGKNRQQEIEHLYKYEFDLQKQYGPPGLEFNEINVQRISNYLNEGFNGNETVYYRNGLPAKSIVTTSYYPDSPQNTATYYFQPESLLKRLSNKILGRKEKYEEIKTVNLRDVFSGLNNMEL